MPFYCQCLLVLSQLMLALHELISLRNCDVIVIKPYFTFRLTFCAVPQDDLKEYFS